MDGLSANGKAIFRLRKQIEMNPLNQLPIDADMVRRVDELAAQCAKETGHTIFVIVVKEGGKCHITMEGVPESGVIAELAEDPPRLLMTVAKLCMLSDALDRMEPQS